VINFHAIFLPVRWRLALLSVDHRQRQCRVALLLTDGRQNQNPPIADFKDGVRWITIVISHLDAMRTFGLDLIHFIGNRVIPVSGQSIDAGSHQEMRSELVSGAKKLVDVAFAVTDVNAPFRLGDQFGSLLQVLQLSDAFLLLYRYPRWIDLLLECRGFLELLPSPEFDSR